jgi:hypothetical protein
LLRRASPRNENAASSPLNPNDSDSSRWFAEQVQPHEGMLRAWLRSRFPTENDVDDVVQEAYARVLEARATTAIDSLCDRAQPRARAVSPAAGRGWPERVNGFRDRKRLG